MFAVFRKRDFSLLWTAQLISTAGSALTDLAAGIYVFRVTGSALAVGLTLMVTAIPSLIVGLLAGVYVDRHDRKTIMIATCLIQAVAGRVDRGRPRHRGDRRSGPVPAVVGERRDQAVLRSGPRQPDP
jgi:MFS family permease